MTEPGVTQTSLSSSMKTAPITVREPIGDQAPSITLLNPATAPVAVGKSYNQLPDDVNVREVLPEPRK